LYTNKEENCLFIEKEKRKVMEHEKCFVFEFTFYFILIKYNFIKDQLKDM
jgi:hypothetical protein